MSKYYDCIVIGGGHAGCEAALASARMGLSTLMINLSFDTIGQMSCNPAIGGVGKGQLVKEIDVLGGAMGIVADKSAIQFRQLNVSKGPAVRSSRIQADRKLYRKYMQEIIKGQENLDFLADEAATLIVKNNKVVGLETKNSLRFECKAIVIAAGTFLKGRMHFGPKIIEGGRIGEDSSVFLANSLESIGFKLLFFKTGTPPRLDGKTIDFSSLEIQNSDEEPKPFSFSTLAIPKDRKLLPCYITYTNKKTHDIIQKNMHLSPMYSGQINATGVRYCPSIEDKLKKFADKGRHQVFLEPEGLDTDLYYPNGISTGLPSEVQEEFVRSIKGLEKVKITQYGYSIEHGIIHPTELKASLETKKVSGLFLAGQINGSTGYEEAAGQGIIAGVNAGLYINNKEPLVLGRDEAYIGVLIDDLVTKGTEEPYRMFTSRVEYRLIIREDNADKRLYEKAFNLGLISNKMHSKIKKKYDVIEEQLDLIRSLRVSPGTVVDAELERRGSPALRQAAPLSDILKRPQVSIDIISIYDKRFNDLPREILEQIEYEIKYEGFILRQKKDVEKFKYLDNIKIPADINYDNINSLSIEIKQKLKSFSPQNLGQANRISGVTPAAISILMIYLKNYKHKNTSH